MTYKNIIDFSLTPETKRIFIEIINKDSLKIASDFQNFTYESWINIISKKIKLKNLSNPNRFGICVILTCNEKTIEEIEENFTNIKLSKYIEHIRTESRDDNCICCCSKEITYVSVMRNITTGIIFSMGCECITKHEILPRELLKTIKRQINELKKTKKVQIQNQKEEKRLRMVRLWQNNTIDLNTYKIGESIDIEKIMCIKQSKHNGDEYDIILCKLYNNNRNIKANEQIKKELYKHFEMIPNSKEIDFNIYLTIITVTHFYKYDKLHNKYIFDIETNLDISYED